ncbi:MAG: hypothetical protein R2793_00525 [Flavobacteriaceae bacterium]
MRQPPMAKNNRIVIGCDDPTFLTLLLSKLHSIIGYSYISTTRLPDLKNLVTSLQPTLVITAFRNNQLAISELSPEKLKFTVPMLCLARKEELPFLQWERKCIVFTAPLEVASQTQFLPQRVNSILLLCKRKDDKEGHTFTNSLASQAIHKNKQLSRYVIELDQKIGALKSIKSKIELLSAKAELPLRKELFSIVHTIKQNLSDKNRWEDFKIYFEQSNPTFLKCLSKKHPELTLKDIKYCCYVTMNMSNDDITHILGINQESVRTHKYRLKKKLYLSKDQSLRNYLASLVSSVSSQTA